MKKLNEEELNIIAYNCKKATFLIEKQQIGTISSREKLELKIHLAGCSICRTYLQQSGIINKMGIKLLQDASIELKLDQAFKLQLQARINTGYG